MKLLLAFFSVFSIFWIGAETHFGDLAHTYVLKNQIKAPENSSPFSEKAKDRHKTEYDLKEALEKETYHYTPDNNPVTWDEDPNNYPDETPDTYINVDDDEVQSPTHYQKVPPGACAICKDGTYSFSKNKKGTCSHHGGVAEWLSKAHHRK
jgi:hypothetical protein